MTRIIVLPDEGEWVAVPKVATENYSRVEMNEAREVLQP